MSSILNSSDEKSPLELFNFLDRLISSVIMNAVMIWGPPGIGKSSVVAQVAAKNGMQLVDLRISQLAPTDLRGLPVPETEKGFATWYPPNFLPRDENSRGILFLDEINMAPPVVQGIAQQLVLDRRTGDYKLPDGWYIWAAGNRKSDGASVYEMKSPLANRFIHLSAKPDMDSYVDYMAARDYTPEVMAFLLGNPELLHKMPVGGGSSLAWPSPRMWDEGDKLHYRKLPIEPAVGLGVQRQFTKFLENIAPITDEILLKIRKGELGEINYPKAGSELISRRINAHNEAFEAAKKELNDLKNKQAKTMEGSDTGESLGQLTEEEKDIVQQLSDITPISASDVERDQQNFLSTALAMTSNSAEEVARVEKWLRKNAPSMRFESFIQVVQPAMRAKGIPITVGPMRSEAPQATAEASSEEQGAEPAKKTRARKKLPRELGRAEAHGLWNQPKSRRRISSAFPGGKVLKCCRTIGLEKRNTSAGFFFN